MRLKGFHIRINDGPEQFFPVKTTIYRDAAAAVPAVYGRPLPCKIEIWAMHEDQELGRLVFMAEQDEFGRFVLNHLVRKLRSA